VSRHLITSKAAPGTCPRCRELTLTGVVEGLSFRVDPYPTAADLEIIAILLGRRTFTLYGRELIYRTGQVGLPGPVLVQHVCGASLRDTRPVPPAPPCFVPPF